MSGSTCPKPYKILTIVVCLAAAAVGAFFGMWYAHQAITLPVLYNMMEDPNELGSQLVATAAPSRNVTFIGALGGLLVGLFWSYMMLRHARKGNVGVGKGVLWGIAAGVIATVFLHRVGHLAVAAAIPDESGDWLSLLVPGLVFGVIAGAINGYICGSVWTAVADKHPLKTVSQE